MLRCRRRSKFDPPGQFSVGGNTRTVLRAAAGAVPAADSPIAARPSDIAKMPESRARQRLEKQEHRKASIRAKVEHPFRVIKRQVGLAKVRFRGLAKNTAHVITLFALSNLWMARKKLMAMTGVVRPQTA